jgi:CcmD family protein
VSDLGWLFVAFAALWGAIGAYVVSLGVRQRRLERRIDELGAR